MYPRPYPLGIALRANQGWGAQRAWVKIKPEKLPPTTGAAAQHSLRAYLQTRDWLLQQSPSLGVLEYGWKQGK